MRFKSAALFVAIYLLLGGQGLASEYHDALTGMKFVYVKGGCYQVTRSGDADLVREGQSRELCVDDFWIGKYEVTQREWLQIIGRNPSKFKGDLRPVDTVSWDDAQAFVDQLSQKSSQAYRLPTEAEWIYAASGGEKQQAWGGTSEAGELADFAWYKENCNKTTHIVGSRRPNVLGLYDMTGNVWEWVQDYAGENPIRKGGSWANIDRFGRNDYRSVVPRGKKFSTYGFRVAITAQPLISTNQHQLSTIENH
jgi:formylglycine-generating enzyme required for sulfatase activity